MNATLTSWQFGFTRPLSWREYNSSGEIHGIPNSRGKAIATDGILVVIERQDGGLFIGHKDSFIEDKEEKKTATNRKASISQQDIAGLAMFE